MEPEVVASVIAALTALVAVIIGPLVTIRAAKNQMLGPMRQKWINDLRDTLSEFMGNVAGGQIVPSGLLSDEGEIRHDSFMQRRLHIDRTAQLMERIRLLINPLEDEHQELVRLVVVAYNSYHSQNESREHLEALLKQTQLVLKKEWEVVKK